MSTPPIIPVLDFKDGQIVHARRGLRDQYQPISSCLTNSSRPRDVARAIRATFGFNTFYMADLDAIQGGEPALEVVHSLNEMGIELLVDAGVRVHSRARDLVEAGVEKIIVGLESLSSTEVLRELLQSYGPQRVIVSLDMKNGQLLTPNPDWKSRSPLSMTDRLISLGVSRLIALDLAYVGSGCGPEMADLCGQLHDRFPEIILITGGGVRDASDVKQLLAAGASSVLVATALHDGRITPAQLEEIQIGNSPSGITKMS